MENYERPSYIHTYIEEHRLLRIHAQEIKNARYDGEGGVCACMGDRPEEKDCMCAMDNADW